MWDVLNLRLPRTVPSFAPANNIIPCIWLRMSKRSSSSSLRCSKAAVSSQCMFSRGTVFLYHYSRSESRCFERAISKTATSTCQPSLERDLHFGQLGIWSRPEQLLPVVERRTPHRQPQKPSLSRRSLVPRLAELTARF